MTKDREPISSAFEAILDSWAAGHINTMMPGQIVSFDRSTGTAVVTPCFKRKYLGQDEPVIMAPINDVPVFIIGSGDRWLTVDLTIDSYVILLISQRSIATWMQDGGIVDPVHDRKFAITDAIALAGLNPLSDALSPDIAEDAIAMRTRDNNAHVAIDEDANVDIRARTGAPIASYSRVKVAAGGGKSVQINDGSGTAIEFARLKTAFDQLKADHDALVVKYNAHIHPGVVTGEDVTLVIVPPHVELPSTADMTAAESSTVKIP